MVDALSRRVYLLKTMSASVIGLEVIKEQYEEPYFVKILERLEAKDSKTCAEFIMNDGYLFKGVRLCKPEGSLREL